MPVAHRLWLAQFGRLPKDLPTGAIWLHAVSLGEVRAAASLVTALRVAWPAVPVVISTTTETGANAARSLGVPHFYAPFDYPFAVRRVLRRLRPRLLLVMETELWPNLFFAVARQSVPVVVINARLSPRSFARYQRWGGVLLAQTLARVSLICAQSADDATRFSALSSALKVIDCGNLKYDQIVVPHTPWAKPPGRPVWLAASTHPGEEVIVLAAHRAVLSLHPNALLVLVPRHPERSAAILNEARGLGFSASAGALTVVPDSVAVWLIGQTGVLMPLFAAVETIFMGGSLAEHAGGHNPIEPALLGRAVISGRGVQNFSAVYDGLAAADAVMWVDDAASLADAVQHAWADPAGMAARGARAAAVIESRRGAVQATIERLTAWLPSLDADVSDSTKRQQS